MPLRALEEGEVEFYNLIFYLDLKGKFDEV